MDTTLSKEIFSATLSFAVVIIAVMTLFFSTLATADMTLMVDTELSEITATGFSQFTLTRGGTDIARVDLNLYAATYTEVGAMQMGYHDNGTAPGWDQSWQTVSLGSQDNDLVMNNFVVETEFQNISDPANRQLESITIGFTDVTGTISSDFGVFSGSIKGVEHERASLGQTSVTLVNEPFLLKLKIDTGVSFQIGW